MNMNTQRSVVGRAIDSSDPHLLSQLHHHGINTSSWGNGATKTLHDLSEEIALGESQLTVRNGQLFRETRVARVAVTGAAPDGTPLTLVEDRQIFKNGVSRHRMTSWAVWEKLGANEDPACGALRGIKEELGVTSPQLSFIKEEEQIEPPLDYPELPTIAMAYEFAAHLGIQRVSTGFVEEQETKATYFEWRPSELEERARASNLFALSNQDLQAEILTLGAAVHQIFHAATRRREFGGLITAEIGSAGGISAALTSFDGSSTYVKGGLASGSSGLSQHLRSSAEWLPFFTVAGEARLLEFTTQHALPAVLAVTNTIIPNYPYGFEFGIKVGDEQKQFFAAIPANLGLSHVDSFERARLVLTALTLEQIATTARTEWPQSPSNHGASNGGNLHSADSVLTPLLSETTKVNADAWRILEQFLLARRECISLGESFTGGQLRECCAHTSSTAIDPVIDTFYLWYDPMWKVAVGVPLDCVNDERITSSETAERGARGLLRTIAMNSSVALATTGWTNRTPSLGPDQFSIGFASRCFDGNIATRSRYVEVTSTAGMDPSFEKRAFTRALGVTTALLMLAEYLQESYEPSIREEQFMALAESKNRMQGLLNRNTLCKIPR